MQTLKLIQLLDPTVKLNRLDRRLAGFRRAGELETRSYQVKGEVHSFFSNQISPTWISYTIKIVYNIKILGVYFTEIRETEKLK